MKRFLSVVVMSAGVMCSAGVFAQAGSVGAGSMAQPDLPASASDPPSDGSGPVPLEWVPPALADLSAAAGMKSSFTLDRNLLAVAAGTLPDDEVGVRHAMNKLEGVSVHLLRFNNTGVPDERAVASIREAYHLRGWKHVVTSSATGGPVHNGTTDVWVVMDGVNVRGAVILAETPRSLSLVTVAGNLSPVDLLHLRGHFGIPRFDDDAFGQAKGR